MADVDGDGDGTMELLINHWNDSQPMRYYKITPAEGGPKVETVNIAEAGKRTDGHGGKDPGANDGVVLYAYKWNAEKSGFVRHPIVVSDPGGKRGPGVG